MAGFITGEMSAAAGGVLIGDIARADPAHCYSHSKIETQPGYLSAPQNELNYQRVNHSVQLLQPASEDTRVCVAYKHEPDTWKILAVDNTTQLDGEFIAASTMTYPTLGIPVLTPEYDDPDPRKTEIYFAFLTQNDIGTTEALSGYIESVTSVAQEATDPAYEVTCLDPGSGSWSPISPNRSCSAYLMKRILGGNTNMLTARSRSVQAVAF